MDHAWPPQRAYHALRSVALEEAPHFAGRVGGCNLPGQFFNLPVHGWLCQVPIPLVFHTLSQPFLELFLVRARIDAPFKLLRATTVLICRGDHFYALMQLPGIVRVQLIYLSSTCKHAEF